MGIDAKKPPSCLKDLFSQEVPAEGGLPSGVTAGARICVEVGVGIAVDEMVEEGDGAAQIPLHPGLCTILRVKEPFSTSFEATSKGALPHL